MRGVESEYRTFGDTRMYSFCFGGRGAFLISKYLRAAVIKKVMSVYGQVGAKSDRCG